MKCSNFAYRVGTALWGIGLSILLLLGNSAPAEAVPFVSCGPGSDWVDNCPAGTDRFHSEARHGVVTFDNGFVFLLPLMTGPTTIIRQAGADDHIETEMVSLNLKQVGGPLTLRAGTAFGLPPSIGRITELPGDPLRAHSFFDIFFEIDATSLGGGKLHNDVACRMTADIDRVPPLLDFYLGCQDPLLSTDLIDVPLLELHLFDAEGVHRAILTSLVVHTPKFVCGLDGFPKCPKPGELVVPEPGSLALLAAGFALLGWSKRRNRV